MFANSNADTADSPTICSGASSLLGYNLVLRIRDLPSKRLYVFNPDTTPGELRKLVGGKAGGSYRCELA